MNKEQKLVARIKEYAKVVVAFSAGVDSTYLLDVCNETLGNKNVLAITVTSNATPKKEIEEAKKFCVENKIKHKLIKVDELKIPGFENNPKDRCYHCKKCLYKNAFNVLEKIKGFKGAVILEGSNYSDNNDYRPGFKAVKELGIKSPLKEAKFTKDEIRKYSKARKLKTFDKPAMACLYSRFVYGAKITHKKLKMIEEAEEYLKSFKVKQVRVRLHDNLVRIEVEKKDFEKLIKKGEQINKKLKEIGFEYVTLDLIGYRTGSMNEVL